MESTLSAPGVVKPCTAAPGEIIAYGGNPLTQAALGDDGIRVSTFATTELVHGNGGPHCLTMPIARS